MRNAPFSITLVLLATLFVSMIAGGVWALILGFFGIAGFWGTFWAAFLTVPLGSLVRQAVAGMMAHEAGVRSKSPMAFSLPIRLAIGAVASAGIAYVFNLSDFFSFGFFMGAIAALMTSACLILIFYFKTAFSA